MRRLLCCCAVLLFLLSGCADTVTRSVDRGSFSSEKTQSYDGKYYALQTVEEMDGVEHAVVSIYATLDDSFVFSFTPARARDFWGICWENDTYNIWIQSADIGILCYEHNGDAWELYVNAVRPDYIISKYDK